MRGKTTRSNADSYVELVRLQKVRDGLEEALSDLKLAFEKRIELEAELAKTRAAIKLVR